MTAPTINTNWKTAVTDTDGDDLPLLVYCDWLDENDQPELATILREWVNTRKIVRMTYVDDTLPADAFQAMIHDYNRINDFPQEEIIEPRKAWMNARIGGCYTHLSTTAEYLCRRPNLLSGQPFRSMTLNASNATQANLQDVLTNWRLQKLWHLTIPNYNWMGGFGKVLEAVRVMHPLPGLMEIRFRGVRDVNFQLSSTLLGLKKVRRDCKIYIGNMLKSVN